MRDESFTPLAPEGLGGHIGGVGLQKEPLQGQVLDNLHHPAGVLKGDCAANANIHPQIHQGPGHLCAAGKAVHHALGMVQLQELQHV